MSKLRVTAGSRLRKHADYQRVYRSGRKQFSRCMLYFFAVRPEPDLALQTVGISSEGPRVGLTVGKVLGKAVDRNRIKRRLRESIRLSLTSLGSPVDVVLHPKRSTLTLPFEALTSEIAAIFRSVERQVGTAANLPSEASSRLRPGQTYLIRPRTTSAPSGRAEQ